MIRTHFSIPEKLLTQLDDYCSQNFISRSELIRDLIRERLTQVLAPFGATPIMRGTPAPEEDPVHIKTNEEIYEELGYKVKQKEPYFGMVQPKDIDNS